METRFLGEVHKKERKEKKNIHIKYMLLDLLCCGWKQNVHKIYKISWDLERRGQQERKKSDYP